MNAAIKKAATADRTVFTSRKKVSPRVRPFLLRDQSGSGLKVECMLKNSHCEERSDEAILLTMGLPRRADAPSQ